MYYKRTVAEIDLDALDFNIKSIIKKVPKGVGIVGTVKADGYGHGAVETAKILRENGVKIFSVALLDEAVSLRKNGIYEDILILGFTPQNGVKDVVRYGITQTISSFEEAKIISEEAKNQNKTAKIHIKIDTGMGRLGFAPTNKSFDEIIDISQFENLLVEGIFTHFAVSDIFDKTFTLKQKERFLFAINSLKERGLDIPIKHCANSAAVIDFEDMFFDMVRPGIVLYGMYPSDEVNARNLPLKPAMSLKTQIAFVKEIEAGESVSYGRTYIADKKMRVATLPVGYADGFSRLLSNRGCAIVNGVKVRVIGRICMDQCMIDVTDAGCVNVGDEVVLLGKSGDEEITAEEIAETIGTINYEVVCMINKRVPRVYMRGGRVVKEVNVVNPEDC
ncbi:MAG: alanine racemase [Firmicutes bacterium]|nr:alanine racemase [Bacillota bacterium]